MPVDRFAFVTAGLYWVLILCWLVILVFYWREHRRLKALSTMISTMLVVVFLDGARTLLESVYFGTWYTARTGLIPNFLWDMLAEPRLVIVPKLVNLLSALTIITVLVSRWFPALREEVEKQRKIEGLFAELQTTHEELRQTHDELQTTHGELKAAQEAQEALTHMIVHDMRTPLTSVITGLQTVQQTDYDRELTPEFVESALQGANRLLLMVNDLLDISKMEAGMMSLNLETVAVDEVIDTATRLVSALVTEKDLKLRVEPSDDGRGGPCLVVADRELLRRIVVNLLGNAVKFTPPSGSITLSAKPQAQGSVIFAVEDTGPGIATEDRGRIFEKFHQVAGANGGSGASTGLGLTFCKMAVEAMGGSIGVRSTLGHGSTFWFTVPVGTPENVQ